MLEILKKWFHNIGRLVMPMLYDLNPKLKPQAKKAPTAAVKKKPGRPKKAAAKK
tara:strand:+ start:318 stop:479 length:162 start_codon:yes stop_codon:yes gene_type:complete